MRLRPTLRPVVAAVLGMLGLLVLAPAASAHPLGNFTVNSFSGLRVEPRAVAVRLVVDSAEIPTVQEFPRVNTPGGVPAAETTAYGEQECDRLQPGLRLRVGGAQVPLTVRSSTLTVLPGQGGLHTTRLTCELGSVGALQTVGKDIDYVDANSLTRTGWREIVAVGDGVELTDSTVPAQSASAELTRYPQDLLTSPLDQRAASMRVVVGDGTVSGPAATSARAGSTSTADRLTASFTDLVAARDLGLGFALLALGISVLLGGAHAFAPGHGKTLMAAYLIGQRSSLREVGIIGLTVTLTHTAGVLVLGTLLSALALTAPARIYAWLGLASGLLLLLIGFNLLRQARRRAGKPSLPERAVELVGAGTDQAPALPLAHDHHQGHDHHHHGHAPDHEHGHQHGEGVTHSHGWGGTHTHPAPATSARGMIAVGFAGGMVPSPSALVVLIGGIALGRAWFGVLLVVGYGVGMALALIGTGLALAHARDFLDRWAGDPRRRAGGRSMLLLRATRALPALTAVLVMAVGVGLVVRSALLV